MYKRTEFFKNISSDAFFYHANKMLKEEGRDDVETFFKESFKEEMTQRIDVKSNTIPEEILKYENIIEMSALNKQGIEEMYNKIAEIFKFNEFEEDISFIITNIRHKEFI